MKFCLHSRSTYSKKFQKTLILAFEANSALFVLHFLRVLDLCANVHACERKFSKKIFLKKSRKNLSKIVLYMGTWGNICKDFFLPYFKTASKGPSIIVKNRGNRLEKIYCGIFLDGKQVPFTPTYHILICFSRLLK